jgi:hypothetical protein
LCHNLFGRSYPEKRRLAAKLAQDGPSSKESTDAGKTEIASEGAMNQLEAKSSTPSVPTQTVSSSEQLV